MMKRHEPMRFSRVDPGVSPGGKKKENEGEGDPGKQRKAPAPAGHGVPLLSKGEYSAQFIKYKL